MTRRPRVVLDTNVVVSALFWGGKPLELMALADEQELRLFASPALLAEFQVTLVKPRLARALVASGQSVEEHTANYRRLVTLARPAALDRRWSRDPDDDHVIACALSARAECIVTGDDDLLALGEVDGILIRTAAEFLAAAKRPA